MKDRREQEKEKGTEKGITRIGKGEEKIGEIKERENGGV